MRIGIAKTETTELVAKSTKETLSDAGFEVFYFKNGSKCAQTRNHNEAVGAFISAVSWFNEPIAPWFGMEHLGMTV